MILHGTNPIAWSNDDDQTIGAHLTLECCLSDCRRIGFDGIEKGHKMPSRAGALKEKLGAFDLLFVGGWHSTNLLVNDMETEKAALQTFIDMTKAASGDHINACECSNTVHGTEGTPVNNRPIMTAQLFRLARHRGRAGQCSPGSVPLPEYGLRGTESAAARRRLGHTRPTPQNKGILE